MTDLRNLNREDELLTMLEEQQDQIETLTKNLETETYKNLESSKKISNLSSENSIMKKELLKKSETIKSLNETIGKLSESDKVLKANEQLAKENLMLRMREKAAREEVDDKLKSLDCREKKAATLEKELADREKHLRKEVNKKVEKKLAEKKKELLYSVSEYEDQLDYRYKMLQAKYMVGFIISLIYGIVITLIQMFKSRMFMKELADFGLFLLNAGGCIYRRLSKIIINLWNIKLIGNATGDRLISIGIILIGLVAIGFLFRFLWRCARKYIKPIIIESADRYLLIAVLVILVVNMLFGSLINSILSINLILSMMCEFGLILLIKCASKLIERCEVVEIWNKNYPVMLFVIIVCVGMILIIRLMNWQ